MLFYAFSSILNQLKLELLTCRRGLHTWKNFKEMEGVITTMSGVKRPAAPIDPSPSKKSNFVGISPLRELTNVKTPTDRPFRVSIEGNIGAGKSTLIKYFQNMQGIETYPEPIEWWRNLDGHNLLDLMYHDIHKWLRVFQTYVQFTRLKVQTTKPTSGSTTVQMFERSIQNNRYCFMEQAYRSGYIHGADYAVLDQWYRWIRANEDISLDLIDECTFCLHAAANRHNCRYWNDSNPRLFREVHSQYPEEINVWAGIFGNNVVGPIFITGNLTGEMYLDMLENTIEPLIAEIIENEDNHNENDLHFQQDGPPMHYVDSVRQFLDTHFPDQWIGRRGPIEWPPKSLDLNLLDYSF